MLRPANGQGLMSTKNVSSSYNNDLENLKLPPIHKHGVGQSLHDNTGPGKYSDVAADRRFHLDQHQLERSIQYQHHSSVRPKEELQGKRQSTMNSKENLHSNTVGYQDEYMPRH